ncbi:MAG: biosynthetic-type acetolactate synthase large subunit [Phoenicibacter congonensis]|uniref:Acetolactate synthase n=1 Tax=Phoenicibacter congonensis TaxID=1944646 RepID=A0AA43U5M7_9ACTN|nr:biosynthetic-type acetolactate synthase large subunit [Phoenicibacter congonensis]
MGKLKGGDILVETLLDQGVDTIFGYPGGQIIDVYDSLWKYRDRMTHVLTAHEQGAAHAADGYARATGKCGVVFATSGPGATNLVTGIATAYLDSVPMLAITGNVPTRQIGTDSFQEIDITGITLPITKHNYFVESVDELADTVREAYQLAISGRPGPVLVDIPKDVQQALGNYNAKPPVEPLPTNEPDITLINEAAQLINHAKRPFIYFGGGMITSEAQKEMLELAEKIDAPIGCSLMGISALPDNTPRFLGFQGMHGHYASSLAMHHADLVISLGVRFNDRTTGNRAKFAPTAQFVHIDIDPSELSKTVKCVCGIRGDLKGSLRRLNQAVVKNEHLEWNKFIAQQKAIEEQNKDTRDGMTPRNILNELNKIKQIDTPVCTDVGQHQMWAAQYINYSVPRQFITSGGLGTMGFGLGASIGCEMATGKHTVLITGDGSFGMCLTELATAVKNEVPIVILILNNGVLGMVRQWQTLFFDKHYSNTILDRQTDFVALAKAFGADGENATTLEEVRTALKNGFNKKNGPYVINAVIDKDEMVLPMLPPGGSVDEIITKLGD